MALLDQLAVQSYCFRNFSDNAEVARMVRAIGLERIEVCEVHADFKDLTRWKRIVEVYRMEGVDIISIGVQNFMGEDSEEDYFRCAAAAGAKHLSAHFRVDSFAKAVPMVKGWSREYRVSVGLHTHGGYQFGGSPDVVAHLLDLGSPEIGLCMDTAWVMQIGPKNGDPVQWADQFSGFLTGIHFKDFRFDSNGQWHDTIVGKGNLDLPSFVKALEIQNFDGVSILEYEADPEDPVPALKRCVAEMRALA